jgi:hypothetical protein
MLYETRKLKVNLSLRCFGVTLARLEKNFLLNSLCIYKVLRINWKKFAPQFYRFELELNSLDFDY